MGKWVGVWLMVVLFIYFGYYSYWKWDNFNNKYVFDFIFVFLNIFLIVVLFIIEINEEFKNLCNNVF